MNFIASNQHIQPNEKRNYPNEYLSENSGKEASSFIWFLIIIVQFPFLGLWVSIFNQIFKSSYFGFIGLYLAVMLLLIVILAKYKRVRFGYTQDGVFKIGVTRKYFVLWSDIKSISLIREYKEFTEDDLMPNDYLQKRRYVYRILGKEDKICVSQYYSESNYFAEAISAISNIPIQVEKWNIIKWLIDNDM